MMVVVVVLVAAVVVLVLVLVVVIIPIVAATIIKEVSGHTQMHISTQHKFISMHREAPSQLPLQGTIQHSHISETRRGYEFATQSVNTFNVLKSAKSGKT